MSNSPEPNKKYSKEELENDRCEYVLLSGRPTMIGHREIKITDGTVVRLLDLYRSDRE